MNFDAWRNGVTATKEGATARRLRALRNARLAALDNTVSDLVDLGISEGYNDAQITTAVEALFRTFGTEIQLYIFTKAGDLATAITNDATLAWLDIVVSGTTVRTRLVNRLS